MHEHRLSPVGLAYWGGPEVAHGWLRESGAWRDPALAPVMGSGLTPRDKETGVPVGYSFPVLYRVADVLVVVPFREWSVRELETAADADPAMAERACEDLVASGHATRHGWREVGGRGREETRYVISVAGIVAWVPWLPDPLAN